MTAKPLTAWLYKAADADGGKRPVYADSAYRSKEREADWRDKTSPVKFSRKAAGSSAQRNGQHYSKILAIFQGV